MQYDYRVGGMFWTAEKRSTVLGEKSASASIYPSHTAHEVARIAAVTLEEASGTVQY
jgi:hypothetical protein